MLRTFKYKRDTNNTKHKPALHKGRQSTDCNVMEARESCSNCFRYEQPFPSITKVFFVDRVCLTILLRLKKVKTLFSLQSFFKLELYSAVN